MDVVIEREQPEDAGAMIAFMNAIGAEIEIIELEVRSDNERAIRPHQKYGFVKIGAYPKFFKMNDNTYVDFDLMNLYL